MRPYRVVGRLCGGASRNRSTVTGTVKTKKLSCLNVFHHKKVFVLGAEGAENCHS